jgi:hypothetical protein
MVTRRSIATFKLRPRREIGCPFAAIVEGISYEASARAACAAASRAMGTRKGEQLT